MNNKQTINNPAPTSITLEDINRQKEELKLQIQQRKEVMTALTRELFAPLTPETNKANAIMRSFNTGMAVFDGVMMGIKIMKKLKKYIRSLR